MPIHPLWLVVILVIVLIIFGPGRLPELGAGIGKAMREFRKATSDITNEVTAATQPRSEPEPAPKSPASETKPTGS
jgi:sec-independent protein translocase protein TatA